MEVVGEPTVPESANHEESSSSHPKATTQTSNQSVLVELANHYSGELPGFEPNPEKASELAFDEVTLESPQQQEPNSEMATNTFTELIIHSVYQPYHLNATHSNISLGIALRNLANKIASSHILFASENPSSEQSTLVVQPLNVALPSEATLFLNPNMINHLNLPPKWLLLGTLPQTYLHPQPKLFKPQISFLHLPYFEILLS